MDSYILVDFDRLRALEAAGYSVSGSPSLSSNLRLDPTDRVEKLPALIANDPLAFGCIVWESDLGVPAFLALKADPVDGHNSSDSANELRETVR